MSENSKIEWTDHTFNPWEGCQKVGPGCDHCYAETRNARFGGGVAVNWGPGAPRRRTSPANWRKPLAWNANHDAFFGEHGRRQRVFCASLADVFDNAVDPAWRADLFHLIEQTPNLDWLLLTKRIGNADRMIREARISLVGSTRLVVPEVLPNVWLGATIVNQAEADRDIPKLLAVPAHVRFLSMEPLLGPVDLGVIDIDGHSEIYPLKGTAGCEDVEGNAAPDLPAIDWVIVGGESGPGARPMSPDWARSLRDQCRRAGVPFLLKQWGEFVPYEHDAQPPFLTSQHGDFFDGHGLPDFESGESCGDWHRDETCRLLARRVGKKAAGRLLDGVQHDGFPGEAA
ncbi:phage Gp37/Gp68 family protein [Cupriavidus necator]|uniref:phage Gp37/Gp68 family protein n=1 Tax=Cupriavidus necator TaxID=106590 RepID=UPI0005B37F9D|nr:phage Gp37/Gp68 family protein [Cupriavidus necator]